ncbi:hypothetical protein AKJ51_01615 [candidate division MSBL1 archaeon SCGC-AAA382A20]|uniref:Uncharacterized protein n=1 Tax=candidate division MSBL1 archaeon SCGC-AAA382A20 TaxID=1698280 RepID=A0A133VLI8_9EURY|nr:hypothetical protein AKJ51_01615 [candidate division MSBL1 archaeon SCGC-AAA382A20]
MELSKEVFFVRQRKNSQGSAGSLPGSLDPKIRPLVRVINGGGFAETIMSCQGHKDGDPFPWVDIPEGQYSDEFREALGDYNESEAEFEWAFGPTRYVSARGWRWRERLEKCIYRLFPRPALNGERKHPENGRTMLDTVSDPGDIGYPLEELQDGALDLAKYLENWKRASPGTQEGVK